MHKIKNQFFLVILITGIVSYCLFQFLWLNKFNVYDGLNPYFHFLPIYGDENLSNTLVQQAKNYTLPESIQDQEAIKNLETLMNQTDKYTSMIVYGSNGEYLAGKYAQIIDDSFFDMAFLFGYRLTDGLIERYQSFSLEFKNGSGFVQLIFYHSMYFILIYAIVCLLISCSFFIFVVLFFLSKKVKRIIKIKESILQMASGNLDSPVPVFYLDEIGIMSYQLEQLRITLKDTFKQEKVNQDQMASLFHDLKTPLTILNGYLEILKRNPSRTEYIDCCMQKSNEINELSNRILEKKEDIHMEWVTSKFIWNEIKEHIDYISLAGFQVETNQEEFEKVYLDIDSYKRILNNIFSNILKYADKQEKVIVECRYSKLVFRNYIQPGFMEMESHRIGLKSVETKMKQMNGELILESNENEFCVMLIFHR
ncbi:ATP-binding protein [Floccifex sp.]|uniref:ATP-binding protein n=1 Tax=Floccifex sp. TaxID=2815810 RepID=UPI003F0FA0DC